MIELLDDITEDAGEPAGIVEISEERLAEAWKKVTDNISNPRVFNWVPGNKSLYHCDSTTILNWFANCDDKSSE